MSLIHGQSRRAHVSDPQVQRLLRGAVAWSVLIVPVIMVMSRVSDGRPGSLAEIDGLPLRGVAWALVLLPALLCLFSLWRGQDSRTALVVPAVALDLGIVALATTPALLFAPAAIAVTVAALARRD